MSAPFVSRTVIRKARVSGKTYAATVESYWIVLHRSADDLLRMDPDQFLDLARVVMRAKRERTRLLGLRGKP